MPSIEIRPIRDRNELEACYDLWADVFPDGRDFFQKRLDHDSSYDLRTTWVAYVDGRLATSIQIFPYETAIEEVSLKIGGIGNVATNPEYRRMGLAQAILRAQSRWMSASGYDASLLFTGIYSFYEQVGWEIWNGRRWKVTRDVFASVAEADEVDVRPFVSKDLLSLMALYEEWRVNRPQARIRTRAYWEDMQNWLPDETWVAESDSNIVGYLRGKVRNRSVIEFREICYRKGYQDILLSFVKSVLEAHPTVGEIEMVLPNDHVLANYLLNQGVAPKIEQFHMWKTIDSQRIIRKLRPVLSRRAQASLNQAERLLLECYDGDICLLAGPDGVNVIDTNIEQIWYHHSLRVNTAQFLQCLFEGIPEESTESFAFKSLFPAQSGVLWLTDRF